ncbi:MAG: PAS domain S-box protein [Sulfurospirillaceae bacterium]|nr:PAS domain S-box protein [Sulfurospirillaceae bacterium]
MLYLQSRYAYMGETIGNIAHQWKQPLNAIGAIQNKIKAALIFQGNIPKDKLLDSVETSFKLLQHLAGTIDTFYSFLAPKNSLKSSFLISDVFETIRKITEYSFQNNNIQLILEAHSNPTIEGDANEFTHAMLNLILNAKDALDNFKPETPTITVKVIEKDKTCMIFVSDNAGGISMEPINKVFDWHISSKTDGSGVGLYMTKNIIEKRFGGTISVENRDNGAHFIIELPYAEYGEYFSTENDKERLSLEHINQLSKKIIELEELEKTLKKWADLFEHARWAITIRLAESNTLEMTNPAFNTLYGYTSEELKNITVPDLFAHKNLDIVPIKQKEAFENGYAVFEAIQKRKDGSLFPASIELIVIKDAHGETLYNIANIWDLTEEKEAEERLKLKKFAIDNIQEAVFMSDEHGKFAYVNDKACRALGYSREELLAMGVSDINPDWPKERWSEFWGVLKEKKTVLLEAVHKRRDGTLFPVEVRTNYFEYDGMGYNLSFAEDITERKAAQKDLLLLNKALNNTNEATYITLGEKIVQVNDGACKMLGYSKKEFTSMHLYEIDKNIIPGTLEDFRKNLQNKNINHFERKHYTKDGRVLDVEIDTSVFEYDGITYAFSSVRDITEQKKAREELLLKEFALDTINEAVYLIDKDSMFHYVNEGACHALGYTKEELLTMGVVDIDTDLTTEFWSRHWESIKNNKSDIVLRYHKRKDGTIFPIEVSANYFEYNGVEYNLAVSRDITERIRLEEQKDNERMRLFFERQIVGMAITSVKEGWIQTNDKLCEMLGYSHEELSQISWVEITHPEDRERDLELFNKIFSGEIDDYTLEKRAIRKNNEIIYINLAVSCVRHEDGSVDYILALIEDITKRKEMEKALVQKEEAYRTLAENNPDSIYRYDRDHRRIYVNPTACRIVGKSAEELIGGTPDDGAILVSQQSKIVDEQIDRVFATGESADFMVNFIEQNGESNDYHMLMVPEYDAEGNVASVLGFTRNVTEIRSLEKRQSQYFAMAPGLFATVLKDVDGNYSLPFVSEGIRDLYGIEPETAMEDIFAFVSIAHPDDTEMTFVKAEESARDLSPYHVEYRINHPYKGIRWIECNSMPQRLPDGSVRWDGFYHDITERKEMEEALKTSEQKFRTLIENATDNIIRYDKEARITYINPQLEKILDVPYESVLGKTPTQDKTDSVFTQYELELKKVIATGENANTYFTFPDTGDGERYHYIQIVAERDVDGNIIGAIAFGRDVTELTNKTNELQKSLEFNEGVIAAIPDLLLEVAPNGTYVGVWAQNPEILAAQREMLLGNDFKEILPPDVVITALKTLKEVDEKGFSLGNTYSLDLPEGKRWFELSASKKKSSGNYIILARDITERKRMEDELKESETRYKKNSNLLKAVLESSPDIITFALDTNYCYIAFNSKHAHVMQSLWGKEIAIGMNMLDVISYDDDRQVAKKSFDRALGGENFISEEIYGDSNFSRSYWEIFYAPIVSDNQEIIGLTCFNIEITERKELEILLEKERKFLTDAQRVANTGSWHLDIKNDLLSWSDETYRIFELDKEQIDDLHKTFYESVHPDDRETVNAPYLESLKTGIPYEIEHRIVMSDGRIKYVVERCEHIYDSDGTPLYSIGTVQDISERKKMEDAILALNETLEIRVESRTAKLQEALDFNKGIVNAVPDLMFEVDRDGKYLNVWAKTEELLATQKELLLGKKISDILSEEATIIAMEAIKESDKKGLSFGKTIKIDLPQGEHWFEISSSKKRDGKFIFISRDITERKVAEIELREREEKFYNLFKLSPAAVSITSLERNIYLEVNESFLFHTKYTREEVVGHSSAELGVFANTNDRTKFFKKVIKDGIIRDFEYAFKAKDGTIGYATAYASIITLKGEKCLLSHSYDRTGKKLAEDALRKSEESFRAMVENSPDMIIRYDLRGRRTYVNRVAQLLMNQPLEKIIGTTPRNYSLLTDITEFEKLFAKVIKEGKELEFEALYKMPNGEIRLVEQRIIPEFGTQGKVMSVLVVGRDLFNHTL